MGKYRITESMIDSFANHEKLRSDGFSRGEISKAFYNVTDGASRGERRNIMGNLYGHARPKPKSR